MIRGRLHLPHEASGSGDKGSLAMVEVAYTGLDLERKKNNFWLHLKKITSPSDRRSRLSWSSPPDCTDTSVLTIPSLFFSCWVVPLLLLFYHFGAMVLAGDPASFLLFWNPQLLFQLLFFSTNCSERFSKVKPVISPLLENHCSQRKSDTSWTEHPSKKYGFWQILRSSIFLQPLVALVKFLFGSFGFALFSCWWQALHRVS